jgi:hypothetical protein
LLLPGAKHYKEFTAVGYSEKDPQKLYDDITTVFDKSKLIYKGINKGGNPSYNQLIRLGVTKKKNFLLGFEAKDGNLRFVTAHRIKEEE